jgi:trk system potassium uptake protein TrkH
MSTQEIEQQQSRLKELIAKGKEQGFVTYAEVSDTVKWLGVFGMLVGRLEVFTLLILFLPAYWRH